jgi:S-DNA-T family DNA segregation ATPase FtsK/SpoIIIE
VIVVDSPALLTDRTGPLRRRLARGDVICVALVAPDASVPAIVDRILDVGDTGAATWIETGGSAWAAGDRSIVIAGISPSTAEAAARRLAPLLDPEDDDGSGGLSASVSLAELDPVDDPTAIARRWTLAGADPAPIARLGLSADGVVDVDLARDGPHGLVAGTTGSGKSELLRTLVVSLAAQSSPDHVTMILVDYKGGSTFDAVARLPHTVGVVTDLDDGLAERVLVSLDAEVRRRERLLRSVGADDLAAYRRTVDDPLPRLVVVIDEFASLARELPDFLGALVSIAQRGRSLGIHLLLATQRPAGVVTDDIRANTNLRIALRLQDRADANDVVGDDTPSRFPPGVPGRAALRLGPEELVVFQTADSSSPVPRRSARLRVERVGDPVGSIVTGPSALDRMVDSICRAAAMAATTRPHRPWIDQLPALVRPRDLEDDDAVGLLDDPAGQCRHALRWTPADGSLLLVGAIASGTTTAAVAVVAACLRRSPPDELHVYVIDAQGEPSWTAFESSHHCGAVVRVSESELLGRLLGRLAAVLDQRATDATREPTIVLAIDGLAAVRDSLGDLAHGEAARRLDRVLRDGPALGVVAVVATDGLSAAGLAVPRSATWVFHVSDPTVARAVGLRAPAVRAGLPGRMRVVESGLEGHVAFGLGAPSSVGEADGRPAPVLVLPELVDAREFDAPEFDARLTPTCGRGAPDGRPIELPIGLAADDLEPALLRVPAGDHVFIGGAARTGRSTALRQVEVAWRRLHERGVVVHIDRRSPDLHADLGQIDDLRPVLVVVDDAERVDDPDGSLGRLLGRPGVTFAVAARLDAVRVAYGHWTREVARSRCGLIMTSAGDVDGELLGATLPRRSTIPARPGLAWIIDHRGHRLAQVAARMPP